MDENEKQSNSGMYSGLKFADDVGKAVGTVKNAVQAAGKAAAGDVAGAVWDILRDEKLRNAVIVALLVFSLLTTGMLFFMGAPIIGTIIVICAEFARNWNENWEKQGINSAGNAIALYLLGAPTALVESVWDTLCSIFRPLTDSNTGKLNANVHNTDRFSDDAANNEEYQTILNSLYSEEDLVGDDGAFRRQIEAIKLRVQERINQIIFNAATQYTSEIVGETIASTLTEIYNDGIFLYRGTEIDVECEIENYLPSTAQAIKILAAYTIQRDCLLEHSDMWDLMDYCGWYTFDSDHMESPDHNDNSDNIYNTIVGGYFNVGIGNSVKKGDLISADLYELDPPKVPIWYGTFAPQWYYEEMSVLLENNRKYKELEAAGNTDALEDMVYYPLDITGKINPANFKTLSDFQPYGIVDILYSSTNATLVVAKVAYEEAGEYPTDWVASLNEKLKKQWDENYDPIEIDIENEYCSCIASRDEKGRNDLRIYLDQYETFFKNYTVMFLRSEDGITAGVDSHKTFISDANQITLGDYTSRYFIDFERLNASQTYTVYVARQVENKESGKKEYEEVPVLTFRTFADPSDATAYRMEIFVDISFSIVSVDELIYDRMGLWPGALTDREKDLLGTEYAAGHTTNDLLVYEWTDVFTDPATGESHELEFQRLQGHQVDAYFDIVNAICAELGENPELLN